MKPEPHLINQNDAFIAENCDQPQSPLALFYLNKTHNPLQNKASSEVTLCNRLFYQTTTDIINRQKFISPLRHLRFWFFLTISFNALIKSQQYK